MSFDELPGGLMVINGTKDHSSRCHGVHAALDKIAAVYKKAGVPEQFQGVFYDGPHEFNRHAGQSLRLVGTVADATERLFHGTPLNGQHTSNERVSFVVLTPVCGG